MAEAVREESGFTGLDLAAEGRLSPLVAALLEGREGELLAPLRHLAPGELPAGPPPAVDRRELAAALDGANRAYGHPAAGRLAERLADPATRVVVTGQQPGLFGGPLYTLSKAVAAARWAAEIEAAGEPAVAVFWVATEDHDFAEVSAATVLGPDGPLRVDLGDDPAPLAPVGTRSLGPRVEEALAAIAALPVGPGWGEWWREVGSWYRPAARFGEAFSRLLVRLLGERCPLLLDSQLPQLKVAQRPWLERLVERREELEQGFAAADRRIEEAGYALQVTPQPGVSPLFVLAGGQRRRIEWRPDGGWALRGEEGAGGRLDELRGRLADNPATVSPGVLARPAVQDAVLGTTLQVLGPGELAYMAQAAAAHRVLGLPGPWVTLRPQAVVLEARQVDRLSRTGLGLADLLAATETLERRLAGGAGRELTAPLRERLAADLDRLRAAAVELDTNLENPWQKTRDHMLRGLDTFTGKLTASVARADEVRRRRVEDLRQTLLPGGGLQERVVCAAHFAGRHGVEPLAESYFAQLDLDPRRLQVIRP